MDYADLVENFNAVCYKCNKAIERANNEIALRATLEIEISELRKELRRTYEENSELKQKKEGKKKK